MTVRPGVLIPRPETEELAQEAVQYLALTEKRRVLDLCTGSGALALAVKKHVPDADVTGTDLSPEALRIAKENAQALSLDITWTEGDLWDGTEGLFDLVICNPPYIPTCDVETLDRTVRAYEPRMRWTGDRTDFPFTGGSPGKLRNISKRAVPFFWKSERDRQLPYRRCWPAVSKRSGSEKTWKGLSVWCLQPEGRSKGWAQIFWRKRLRSKRDMRNCLVCLRIRR